MNWRGVKLAAWSKVFWGRLGLEMLIAIYINQDETDLSIGISSDSFVSEKGLFCNAETFRGDSPELLHWWATSLIRK